MNKLATLLAAGIMGRMGKAFPFSLNGKSQGMLDLGVTRNDSYGRGFNKVSQSKRRKYARSANPHMMRKSGLKRSRV